MAGGIIIPICQMGNLRLRERGAELGAGIQCLHSLLQTTHRSLATLRRLVDPLAGPTRGHTVAPVCAPLAASISASGMYRAAISHRAFAHAWTSLPHAVTAPDHVPTRMGLGPVSPMFNGNPLQYSCLENSMDRGFWQATVHGVAKSRT